MTWAPEITTAVRRAYGQRIADSVLPANTEQANALRTRAQHLRVGADTFSIPLAGPTAIMTGVGPTATLAVGMVDTVVGGLDWAAAVRRAFGDDSSLVAHGGVISHRRFIAPARPDGEAAIAISDGLVLQRVHPDGRTLEAAMLMGGRIERQTVRLPGRAERTLRPILRRVPIPDWAPMRLADRKAAAELDLGTLLLPAEESRSNVDSGLLGLDDQGRMHNIALTPTGQHRFDERYPAPLGVGADIVPVTLAAIPVAGDVLRPQRLSGTGGLGDTAAMSVGPATYRMMIPGVETEYDTDGGGGYRPPPPSGGGAGPAYQTCLTTSSNRDQCLSCSGGIMNGALTASGLTTAVCAAYCAFLGPAGPACAIACGVWGIATVAVSFLSHEQARKACANKFP